MLIRNAEARDLTDLMRLTGVLGYSPADAEEFSQRLERLLAKEGHILLVADVDGRAHGFVEAEAYETLCVQQAYGILGLVVDEEFQAQGIGGQLIEAIETEIRKRAVSQVFLHSGEQRRLAHEFYEKHGYALDHMQKKFVKNI
ncbi:N-acetyltransferase family protein [Lactovum odontotermitis]